MGSSFRRRWSASVRRMEAAGLASGLLLLLVACAGLPQQPIPQPAADGAAIGFSAQFRAPLGAPTYAADVLYLAPVEDGQIATDDTLVATTFARDGRLYAFNLPPGNYAVVAVLMHQPGLLDEGTLYVAFLDELSVARTSVSVSPGRFVFGGAIDVDTDLFVCPDNSDATQLRVARLLFPGSQVCGWMTAVRRAANEGVVFGGSVYGRGTIMYPYRGRLRELQVDTGARARFLPDAAKDLAGTAWADRLPAAPARP